MSKRDFFEVIENFSTGKLTGFRLFSGSNRQFYRVKFDDSTCVILVDEDKEGLIRYALLLRNLHKRNIPVPVVLAVDETTGIMVMEDIGDLSLYKWFNDTKDIQPHLSAIEALTKIHVLGDVPGKFETEFDIPDLLFETQYFIRHFLVGYIGMRPSISQSLDGELKSIAYQASHSPKGMMHRDFQSLNVFVVPGGIRIVDFQGVRRGYIGYDLVSLIEDPYLNLDKKNAQIILNHYLDKSSLDTKHKIEILKAYDYLALQRLLQATAAFAYLSRIQKKEWFETQIPFSIGRIKVILNKVDEFPILQKCIAEYIPK